jgi:hypothetical protein
LFIVVQYSGSVALVDNLTEIESKVLALDKPWEVCIPLFDGEQDGVDPDSRRATVVGDEGCVGVGSCLEQRAHEGD